jgi:hypothetical protein
MPSCAVAAAVAACVDALYTPGAATGAATASAASNVAATAASTSGTVMCELRQQHIVYASNLDCPRCCCCLTRSVIPHPPAGLQHSSGDCGGVVYRSCLQLLV